MKLKILYLLLILVVVGMAWAGCQLLTPGGTAPVGSGGTLNLYGIDPLTLDPAVSREMTSHQYVMQIFSGLVRLDDKMEVTPDIAQGWKVSKDGRTYTFTLRQGVKFQDGREVKAADFKYSWDRACNPATGSLTAATYLGDIVGAADVLEGKAKEISGVRVVDDYTIEIQIDAPKSYFLSKMTYPTAFVVDRANTASGANWWRQPNGTGPFKLRQWAQGSQLVLERNTLYYGKVAGVAAVVFHLWAGVPMDLYETGKIDVSDVSLAYIDKVTDKAGPFFDELATSPELSFFYIGFDVTRPPFDDINVRRAFSMAVDKEKLITLTFRNMVPEASGVLPPGMPGFNEDLLGLPYDVNGAKELLRQSKYGDVSNLPPITITTQGWGGLVSSSLEAIVYQWRENLGVEVEVRQLEPERFLYYLKDETDNMFEVAWIADYPHPQNFLEVLFHSGTEENYGGYSNPEVDALLRQAGTQTDVAQSRALYQQAEQLIVDDAASIPLWHGQNYVLVKPYVKGYKVNPLGIATLNEVTIEPH